MANYTTNLKTWGATGQAHPDNYSYVEKEAPVDAWDNFLNYNLISDVKNHLIPLTNSRIESDSGSNGSEPTNPESGHLYYDSDNQNLKQWDSTNNHWNRLLTASGDSLGGSLDFSGYAAKNVGPIDLSGDLDLAGSSILDGGSVLFDPTSGQFADADTVDGKHAADLGSGVNDSGTKVVATATTLNFNSNISITDNGNGKVTIDGQVTPDTHTSISENGTETVSSVDDIDFTGHLNVVDDGDGSVTLDPTHNHDSMYISKSEAITAVNNENSLSVDISGDANTVGGKKASEIGVETVDKTVPSTESKTIAVGESLVLADSFTAEGDVTISGSLSVI